MLLNSHGKTQENEARADRGSDRLSAHFAASEPFVVLGALRRMLAGIIFSHRSIGCNRGMGASNTPLNVTTLQKPKSPMLLSIVKMLTLTAFAIASKTTMHKHTTRKMGERAQAKETRRTTDYDRCSPLACFDAMLAWTVSTNFSVAGSSRVWCCTMATAHVMVPITTPYVP